MVYCTKCGTQNADDARVCSKCGASLYAVGERGHYRRMESECFGIPKGGTIVAIAIGTIIVLWGLITILQQSGIVAPGVEIWPIAVIIFGILIVIGALYGLSRRH
ncbi:zinc-ribbon domain-containing protein [Candidatus Bathyarchaeota archaeon]|nr:zinc-ribbon domain-containing protein [Candidatus Bathyarchaeota archaeon]